MYIVIITALNTFVQQCNLLLKEDKQQDEKNTRKGMYLRLVLKGIKL